MRDLPLTSVVTVGGCRVGVVHGDPDSLAGWGFGAEMMPPLDASLRGSLGVPPGEFTPEDAVEVWFDQARVTAFACTHTCLAYAQGVRLPEGRRGAVFNNGSAGMPNFNDCLYGVITRVSQDTSPPKDSLYGVTLAGEVPGSAVRIDAVPVHYDVDAFWKWFGGIWEVASPAYISYAGRIRGGVKGYAISQADRLAPAR